MLCLLSTPYCFSSFSTGSFSLDVSPMQKKNIGILFGPTQPTSRQTLGPKIDNGPWAFYLYEIGTQIASPHQRRHLFFFFQKQKSSRRRRSTPAKHLRLPQVPNPTTTADASHQPLPQHHEPPPPAHAVLAPPPEPPPADMKPRDGGSGPVVRRP